MTKYATICAYLGEGPWGNDYERRSRSDMRNTIPEIIEQMRFHAEQDIKTDKRNKVSGILTTEGMIIKGFAEDIEEIWKDRKTLLVSLLDEYKHKHFCGIDYCPDCEHQKECNAIRNVTNLILTGELLKEDEL